MDIEETLQQITIETLNRLEVDYSHIEVEQDQKDNYNINIKSENPSLLIGYHGENMLSLQHVIKVLAYKKCQNSDFNILVDVDDYRKRQEQSVLNLAERRIAALRKNGRPQTLPPMSAYFRRKIHLHCTSPGYEDIETVSEGEGPERHLVLKLK